MFSPGHLSIKHKLVLMIMGVALFALVFAGVVLVRSHLQSLKTNLSRNLSVLAGTIGFNDRAALYFEDKEAARNILSSVKEEPQVQFAAVYNSEKNIFVQYSRDPKVPFRGRSTDGYGVHFVDGGVEVLKPIILKDKEIGAIYLFSDLREYQNAFWESLIFFGITLALTLVLCLALAVRIQAFISKPILKLADTAGYISLNSNYSIRVVREEKDEIGTLYTGFNTMIEAVENRENELVAYKDNLENMIRKRTQELEAEINIRKKIENDLKGSLKDKEILLREINHRAKNNMQIISSLLWLQAYKISEKEYADKFRDCSLRLQTMSMIHENLYDSEHLHDIDLNALISKLIDNLATSYKTEQNIQFHLDIEEIKLDIEKNMLCGLIIHELVSNALKHAFPNGREGMITIRGRSNVKDQVELRISDNGAGFDDAFNLDDVNSVGLQLVTSLVRDKLKGSLHLSRSPESEFIITFPRD